MPLTIEDGTIVAGANSYATVAEADVFLELMGNSAWAALGDEAKEANLAKGAFVVDDGATYIYDGQRVAMGQTMAWPRAGATYNLAGPLVPPDAIPPEIKRAQIVAAGGIANGSITYGGSLGPTGLVKSESVDVLSVTYFSPKEAGQASAGAGGPYADLGWPQITSIVAPLLNDGAYEDQDAGTGSAVAAQRGPRFTRPSYRGIWDVGMDDYDGVPGAPATNCARGS